MRMPTRTRCAPLFVRVRSVDCWNKVAIIFEGDTPDVVRHITYGELLRSVCRLAHVLRDEGLTKGDTVGIYMPHIPEAAIAMLACARLGLPHSVIFGGFSAEALRSRLIDTGCKVVITADEGKRAGKRVPLKKTVDEAVEECPLVRRVVVFMHTGSNISMNPARDVYWHDAVVNKRPYIPPVACSAEDPLFLLYTSGSTGKPKGLMHTTVRSSISLADQRHTKPGLGRVSCARCSFVQAHF